MKLSLDNVDNHGRWFHSDITNAQKMTILCKVMFAYIITFHVCLSFIYCKGVSLRDLKQFSFCMSSLSSGFKSKLRHNLA
jgi:hypothetical protein